MDFIIKFMLGWVIARALLVIVTIAIAVIELIRIKNK